MLKILLQKGASNQTLQLIAAFLSSRQMSVKVNQKLSTPRNINGGSPHGCVSANALFCATIEWLQETTAEESYETNNLGWLRPLPNDSTMYAGETILQDVRSFGSNGQDMGPISPLSPTPFGSSFGPITPSQNFKPRIFSSLVEQGINFSSHITDASSLDFVIDGDSPRNRHQAGMRVWNRINDTPTLWQNTVDNTQLNEMAGVPEGWREEEEWTLKYIDDGITGELICNTNAVCHVTQRKEEKYLHAKRC